MELKILNIQSVQQQLRDHNLQLAYHNLQLAYLHLCPLSMQTANLLFMEVIQLGLRNQKRLMHAINNLSTNIRPDL